MNLARKTTTPDHIIERNRINGLSSTGPKPPEGRVRSRQNALKHGLCADPAAGVVEDRGQFNMPPGSVCSITPDSLTLTGTKNGKGS